MFSVVCFNHSASLDISLKLYKKKSFLLVVINNTFLAVSCCFFHLRRSRQYVYIHLSQRAVSQLMRDWK